ncbi:sugar transferase [Heyndrickxia coagulans]|uniref:sugar transferase n=1 Tax=Heyndrickxia coagulans TaxID=1398 RepID=UPI002E24E92E|nr:sugar transferase [Heyndrickxia coagulans]
MNLSDLGYSKDIPVQSSIREVPASMPNTSKIYAVCKRTLDIILALIGLIILSPGFIILSIFYLYGENKGPLIFKQKRVGKNGKVFFIYKFRSMVVDADKKLKENRILYQRALAKMLYPLKL